MKFGFVVFVLFLRVEKGFFFVFVFVFFNFMHYFSRRWTGEVLFFVFFNCGESFFPPPTVSKGVFFFFFSKIPPPKVKWYAP